MSWDELSTARRHAKFGRLRIVFRTGSYPERALEMQKGLI